jgi:hypothetical protein
MVGWPAKRVLRRRHADESSEGSAAPVLPAEWIAVPPNLV